MRALKGFLDRLPTWAVAVVAVACIVVGVVLTFRPFTSIEVLVLLVGISALLTGTSTLASPETDAGIQRWLVGIGWLALGGVVLAWPGLTVEALAIVVGVGLLVHGLVELGSVVAGTIRVERAAAVLSGLVACLFGALALSWPDVTVFVVALIFGARTVLFGISQLVAIVGGRRGSTADATQTAESSRLRHGLRLLGLSLALVVALALVGVSALLRGDERTISAFYDTPDEIPATPGVLLRTEPFTDGIPVGADGWLILYSTQTSLGEPAVASAVVIAPTDAPDGPMPLIAWTHGTVGIDRPCAPSLSGDPFAGTPIEPEVLENGWAVVATDYVGMGTEGVSPYLVGTGQARSALDSIRAARQMTEVELSEQTVVWGHSQGGHAALWTGMEAGSYAPELDIEGVAALAPATDLSAMADSIQDRLGGSLLSSYVITAYSNTYDDVDLDRYVRPGARVDVRETSKRCVGDPSLLATLITSMPSSQSLFAEDVTTGPSGARLAENVPTDPITVPLLVAQGTADEIIPYSITEGWIAERCADGQALELVTYPDRTHMSILDADSPLHEELTSWTADRFAGRPAEPTC